MEQRNYKLYVHIAPNGKRYYGITCEERVQNRWKNGRGYKGNEYFTRAINKYGWDNIEHIVLFNNLTVEEASLLEQMYIALYDTTNNKYGYNNSLGGEHGLHSDETKRKISEGNKGKNKGKHHTNEAKMKISEAMKGENHPNYGKPMTQEQKRKISESHKGIKPSEETKKKMSESHKGKHTGENNPMYGKQFTEEHKKKMSENNAKYWKGKHLTEETKQKISESRKGKYKGKNSAVATPVLMFTLDGQFIRKFDCIREAIQYLGKDNGSNISACAKGKKPTAYGYIWKYEEDYIKEQEQQAI